MEKCEFKKIINPLKSQRRDDIITLVYCLIYTEGIVLLIRVYRGEYTDFL